MHAECRVCAKQGAEHGYALTVGTDSPSVWMSMPSAKQSLGDEFVARFKRSESRFMNTRSGMPSERHPQSIAWAGTLSRVWTVTSEARIMGLEIATTPPH